MSMKTNVSPRKNLTKRIKELEAEVAVLKKQKEEIFARLLHANARIMTIKGMHGGYFPVIPFA